MRISKLVKIVTLAFIALSSVAIVTTFLSSRAVTNMGKAYETQSQFNQLGLQLQNASDLLTQQAQAYVQYGEKKYYDAYWYEINTDKNRDKAIQELTNLGAPKNEMDLVVKAGQLSNTLAELESRAFDEVEKGNLDEARKLMFGDLYEQGKMPIITTMDEFQSTMNSRTQDDALRAKNLAKTYSAVSLISVISAVLVGVMGLIFMYVKITPINKIVEMANQISDGNMNVNFLPKSKDEIGDLSESFEKVCRVVNSLINDISKLATNQAMGEIDYFVNETTYSGSYKILVSEVNAMCKNSYGDLMSIIDNITHIANGDFNADIKKLPGKKAIASENLNIMRENLKSVAKDIKSLVNDATIGELSNRTDIRKYSGDWADLLNSLNQLMEAIAAPIYESAEVLHQVSVGNFDYKVCGAYKGDFLLIKNSINNTITNVDSYIADISSTLGALSNDDLSQEITREYVGKYSEIKYAINNIIDKFSSIISEIFKAADHIASGARNISEGSTILAQGASEQASSVEELNATIMTINENTMMTAQDSKIAKDLSVASQNSADEGNRDMKNMLTSMEKIKDSTQNIAKIITVIDDIAFQTNLLALNAAVEAARAGEHGKGFAVVAEEVRSLASRSQNSAKETSELIAESITNVNDGSKMAATTATALNTITSYTTKISDIIKDIATASAQQAEAIGHVTIGITQIAGVVQNNSATSEESASTSQQLSCQSEILKNLVSRFKLKSSQL